MRTLSIQPDYLKTHGRDGFVNYSEWSIPLGRRFRALKLWFLLRAYGLEALRAHDPQPRRLVAGLCERLARHAGLRDRDRTGAVAVHLPPARRVPMRRTLALVEAINDDGRIYLTQTRVDGRLAIRFQAGSFETTAEDVDMAYDVITEIDRRLG